MKRITKILSAFVLVFACFAGVLSFSGCDFGGSANIESIALSKAIKTAYVLGDEIDFNDAKLIVRYDDDSEKEISLSISMVSGFDTTTITESGQTRTLTITYKGKQNNVTYTVSQPNVQELLRTAYQNLINVEDVELCLSSRYADSDQPSRQSQLIKNGDNFKYYYYHMGYETAYIYTSPTFKCTSDDVKSLIETNCSGPVTNQDVMSCLPWAIELHQLYTGVYALQVEVKIESGKYKITGDFSMGNSADYTIDYTMEIIISLDKKIESFKVNRSNEHHDLSYFYTNVPQISFPKNENIQ